MHFVKNIVWILIAFSCEAKEILASQITPIVIDNLAITVR